METTGNDVTGNGLTVATAFRQPQRAVNEIPNGAVGTKTIQCGSGTFESPVVNTKPGNTAQLIIDIWGDRTTPLVTFAGEAWTQVASKTAQWEATVSAFTSPIADYTSWMYTKSVSTGVPFLGAPVLASTTPLLRMAGSKPDQFGPTAPVAAYAWTTAFTGPYLACTTVNENASTASSSVSPVRVNIWGIKFPAFIRCSDVNMMGCLLVLGAYLLRVSFYGANQDFTYCLGGGAPFSANLSGVFLKRPIVYNSGHLLLSAVMRSTATAMLDVVSTSGTAYGAVGLSLVLVDFETAVPCIRALNDGDSVVIQQNGNISISGAPTSFLTLGDGGRYKRVSGTITGAVNGVPVVLTDGAQALGIKAAANGTLINSAVPGNEITVGGLAVSTFALQPTSDFAAGSAVAQGCRAT